MAATGTACRDIPLLLLGKAGLGAESDGTWNLTVTSPGRGPRRFRGLQNGSSEFRKLTWLGFSSTATDKAVFFLDDLELDLELTNDAPR